MARPWKHVYDGIIEHYMMKQCMVPYMRNKNVDRREVREYNERYVPLPQSVSELYRVVRDNGQPRVTRKTVRIHLDDMAKRGVLVKYPNGKRQYNTTLYRLSEKRLMVYLGYLLLPAIIRFIQHGLKTGQLSYSPTKPGDYSRKEEFLQARLS